MKSMRIMEKPEVCARKKKMEPISLDASAFALLDIYELHTLF